VDLKDALLIMCGHFALGLVRIQDLLGVNCLNLTVYVRAD
jgi:hypothetical protein